MILSLVVQPTLELARYPTVKLYFIRHGDAYEFGDPRWPNDQDRPLSPEGEQEVKLVAEAIGRLASPVDQVISSPVLRAKQTAEIVIAEVGWPEPILIEEIAGRSPAEMLESLIPWKEAAALAVVGHAPTLPDLASYLLNGSEEHESVDMKKGAALCLSFEGTPTAGGAVIEWLIVPKGLAD